MADATPQVSGEINELLSLDTEAFAKEFGLDKLMTDEDRKVVPPDAEEVEPDPDEAAPADDEEGEEGEEVEKVDEKDDEQDEKAETKPEEKPEAKKTDEKAEPRKLATDFKVEDAEGELDPVDLTGLKFTFKADGKDREVVGLDKVVRLAKMGFHNEALLSEVETNRTENVTLKDKVAEYEQYTNKVLEYARALLTDDGFLLKERERQENQNTPEARAERLERENARLRRDREVEVLSAKAVQVADKLEASVGAIFEQVKDVLTEDELMGRFERLTSPLKVNGQVPPHRWSEVERIVERELSVWAQGTADSRRAEREAVTSDSKKKTEEAKGEVKKVKRAFARAIKPAPASVTSKTGSAPAKRKPIATRDEAENDILADVLGFVKTLG